LGHSLLRILFEEASFHELSFNIRLFLCAQLSHLKNFALARFSRIFHFARTNVQFGDKKRYNGENAEFVRARVGKIYYVLCMRFSYLAIILIIERIDLVKILLVKRGRYVIKIFLDKIKIKKIEIYSD